MSSTFTSPKLLAQIAHDLRNYACGIAGSTSIITRELKKYQNRKFTSGDAELDSVAQRDLEQAIELSEILKPHTMEMLQYVDDLLDESQVENGEFSLGKTVECNLEDIVKRVLILNKTFIIDQQVAVKTNIEENLPKLYCDERRLKQILTNLLTNAVKYSYDGSEVMVDICSLDNQVFIKFIDQGIGMSADEIAMALNGDGQKIDKSLLDKSFDSHGIGMPIVKHLVELMGGELKIESKKGEGTTVEVVLVR